MLDDEVLIICKSLLTTIQEVFNKDTGLLILRLALDPSEDNPDTLEPSTFYGIIDIEGDVIEWMDLRDDENLAPGAMDSLVDRIENDLISLAPLFYKSEEFVFDRNEMSVYNNNPLQVFDIGED